MGDAKRKRSPNWLSSEKMLLVEIVEKHFNIVENKKTDGVTMKAKLAEWKIISMEYNSQTTHCHREAENLKAQWENMKKAAKKDASQARMQRIRTGGGPADIKKEDPVHSRIISLITTSAIGLFNSYDSDSIAPDQAVSETVTSKDLELENQQKINLNQALPVIVEDFNMGGLSSVEIEVKDWNDYTPNLQHTPVPPQLCTENYDEEVTMRPCEPQAPEIAKNDWGDYTPQLLKTPVSAQLNINKDRTGISRRRPILKSTSLERLHEKKMEALNLQKTLAVEEAAKNKTISEREIEIKKEILKQEKVKTRLLLLKLRKMRKNVRWVNHGRPR